MLYIYYGKVVGVFIFPVVVWCFGDASGGTIEWTAVPHLMVGINDLPKFQEIFKLSEAFFGHRKVDVRFSKLML